MPTLPLNEWIKFLGEFYNQYGYLTVFLGTLGENTAILGFLLPGNSLALLGAMYARLGTLNLGWVLLGLLVLLFFAWRFFGRPMRQRIRQEHRAARRKARSVVGNTLR